MFLSHHMCWVNNSYKDSFCSLHSLALYMCRLYYSIHSFPSLPVQVMIDMTVRLIDLSIMLQNASESITTFCSMFQPVYQLCITAIPNTPVSHSSCSSSFMNGCACCRVVPTFSVRRSQKRQSSDLRSILNYASCLLSKLTALGFTSRVCHSKPVSSW